MAKKSRKARRRVDVERPLVLVLLFAVVVLFAVGGVVQGPKIARIVHSEIGMRGVEAHAPAIVKVASAAGLDPALMAGICYVESRGKLDALSSKGAMGLFQLMPSAASDAAQRLKLNPPTKAELLSNAELNARLAASHLVWLHKLEGPEWERTLVAYNAGRGKLKQWLDAAGGWERWRATRAGRSETLHYAQTCLAYAERFRARESFAPASAVPPAESTSAAAQPPRR
jgi:soluble lytic murein transglycosylase-like protein